MAAIVADRGRLFLGDGSLFVEISARNLTAARRRHLKLIP